MSLLLILSTVLFGASDTMGGRMHNGAVDGSSRKLLGRFGSARHNEECIFIYGVYDGCRDGDHTECVYTAEFGGERKCKGVEGFLCQQDDDCKSKNCYDGKCRKDAIFGEACGPMTNCAMDHICSGGYLGYGTGTCRKGVSMSCT
eukprot:283841_1